MLTQKFSTWLVKSQDWKLKKLREKNISSGLCDSIWEFAKNLPNFAIIILTFKLMEPHYKPLL